MLRPRIIPVLLLKGRGFYKTINFKDPQYIGDPVNTLRIFCEKEADEVVILDISATLEGRPPQLETLRDIVSESFMPISYGGGIRSVDQVRDLLNLGIEKVVINTAFNDNPDLIRNIADFAGSSSVVVSLDVRKRLLGGYQVYVYNGRKSTGKSPLELVRDAERLGAGEILINSIDRDGTMKGYDLDLIQEISKSINIPVVACGGAGSLSDLRSVLNHGANAAAAGSMFVYQGKHKAVLISYPTDDEIIACGTE